MMCPTSARRSDPTGTDGQMLKRRVSKGRLLTRVLQDAPAREEKGREAAVGRPTGTH
jgi:hypothetical protein